MDRNYSKAILYIIISAAGFACMSFFVKLAGDLPVFQKGVFRNSIAAVLSIIMLRSSGQKFRIGKGNYFPMFMRCAMGTVGLMANFWAIQNMHIGDSNILTKMSPFFSIIMSIFILGEKPDKVAIGSVIAALIGAAFVVKPGRGLASLPALIGLFGGFCAGTAYTFVRKMGTQGVPGPVIVFCFSAFSVLSLLPLVILFYEPMSLEQLGCLLLAGVAAAVGQIFVTRAYTLAPAKEISVFDYTQVLFAALLGFLVFGEKPDVFSFIGYVIIIGAAFTKWYLNKRESAALQASS